MYIWRSPDLENSTCWDFKHNAKGGKMATVKGVYNLIKDRQKKGIKIGYTDSELEWVKENELYIWQYFVERQVLYQTEVEWVQRFLEPAPFSKFYLQLDNESPGRVGRWIGWQIIDNYMSQYPETSLEELLRMPAQKLFNLSKYKPKR